MNNSEKPFRLTFRNAKVVNRENQELFKELEDYRHLLESLKTSHLSDTKYAIYFKSRILQAVADDDDALENEYSKDKYQYIWPCRFEDLLRSAMVQSNLIHDRKHFINMSRGLGPTCEISKNPIALEAMQTLTHKVSDTLSETTDNQFPMEERVERTLARHEYLDDESGIPEAACKKFQNFMELLLPEALANYRPKRNQGRFYPNWEFVLDLAREMAVKERLNGSKMLFSEEVVERARIRCQRLFNK